MKALARRGFLKLLPATPFAVRTAAEETARTISKIEVSGVGQDNSIGARGLPSTCLSSTDPSADQWRTALRNLGLREQIESLIYENNRFVNRIDPDIAVLRSYSLNAKIAFQRQRNVALDLKNFEGDGSYPYARMVKLILGQK